MFNLFKKREYTHISGKVERICVTPCNDTALTYLIKLQNHPQVFEVTVSRGSKAIKTIGFTKENDSVSFAYTVIYPNTNFIISEAFANTTFSV